MVSAATVHAATIQSTTYNTKGINKLYYSQGITMGSRADWDTISFAFDMQRGVGFEAYSAGDLFILTENHLGSPADLSSSTSGFVAKNNGFENGFWTFDRDVTLEADTTYYFVMGDRANATATRIRRNRDRSTPGLGFSRNENGSYRGNTGDLDYMLRGEVAAPVPLPATALLLVIGLAGLGAASIRRRAT